MIGIDIYWKVRIQPDISSESTDGEIRCMYKAFNKTKAFQRYMKALELHNSKLTLHLQRQQNVYLCC